MVLLLVLNLPLAPLWAKLLRIPRPYLYAGILFFASRRRLRGGGAAVDLVMLLVIGADRASLMRRYGLPVLPGDHRRDPRPGRRAAAAPGAADRQRRLTTLISTPLAVIVYLVILVLLLLPAIRALRRRGRDGGPTDPDHSEPAGAGRSAQS